MSSQKSPPQPSAAEHAERLTGALVDVAESSLFAFVETCDWPTFQTRLADAPPSARWVRGLVGFAGPIGGHIALSMPKALAQNLCTAFAGLEPDEPVPDRLLADFAGETTNMVCGAWLTGLGSQATFTLRAPQVAEVVTPDARNATPGDPGRHVTIGVFLDDAPVLLDLDLDEARGDQPCLP